MLVDEPGASTVEPDQVRVNVPQVKIGSLMTLTPVTLSGRSPLLLTVTVPDSVHPRREFKVRLRGLTSMMGAQMSQWRGVARPTQCDVDVLCKWLFGVGDECDLTHVGGGIVGREVDPNRPLHPRTQCHG